MIAALFVENGGSPQIISRAEAQQAGLAKYYTGKPCKNGHIAYRHVSGWSCTECAKIHSEASARNNPEKRKESYRAWRARNAEKVAAAKKLWKLENRDKHNEYRRLLGIRKFMSVDSFLAMFDQQGGLCAICGTDKGSSTGADNRRLAIDHCHSSNVVRGLLCGNCNRMLGLAKDSPEVLRKAAAYLEKNK